MHFCYGQQQTVQASARHGWKKFESCLLVVVILDVDKIVFSKNCNVPYDIAAVTDK
jgi:hypothetical protein